MGATIRAGNSIADGSGLVAMIAPPAITMPSQISRTLAQFTDVPRSTSPKGRSKAIKSQIKPVLPTKSDQSGGTDAATVEKGRALAKKLLEPEVQAGLTAESFRPHQRSFTQDEFNGLVEELRSQTQKVASGDLRRAEEMLVAQAHTLDTIFNRLAGRAALNMGSHLNAMDKYLRLALKAQAQSRATLETLANIKNPPIVYARQANFANGPQQVNNGVTAEPAHAAESGIEQNEVLEVGHEQRMDPRAQGSAGRGNQAVAAVVAIDRAQDRQRQGQG